MARNTETIKYFPKNLQNQELYKFFSLILDQGLEKFFDPNVDYVEHLFKPHLNSFDPDSLIRLLGGQTLLDILEDRTGLDMAGFSQIMPDFIGLKGTMEGFLTALRIAKIDYKYLKLLKTREGCTRIVIVVDNSQEIIPRSQLVILARLAEEILPVCVKLSSITNCLNLKSNWDLGDYDEWYIDLGVASLSQNWRLDHAVFGRPTGAYITDKDGLLALFCRKQQFLFLEEKFITAVHTISTKVISNHQNFYKNYADKYYNSGDYSVGVSKIIGYGESIIVNYGYNSNYNTNYNHMENDSGYLRSDYTEDYQLVNSAVLSYSEGYSTGYFITGDSGGQYSGYNQNYNYNYIGIRELKPLYGGKGNIAIYPIQTTSRSEHYDFKSEVPNVASGLGTTSAISVVEDDFITYPSIDVPSEYPKVGVYTLFDYEPEEYET